MENNFLTFLKFDKEGLIPVIVEDEKGVVLMLAYMDKETLLETLKTGKMHYYSRSRRKKWLKGEESGNFQFVKEFYIDCDGDALLFKVEQKGGACHTGYYSCFFRKFKEGDFIVIGDKIFEPDNVYKK